MFQQFLKWREKKYERERAEERHDKRFEYEEDKRWVELEFREFLKLEKIFGSGFFSEYARRPAKYEEEQREDRYERLEDDREYERRRNRDLWGRKIKCVLLLPWM